ncbi:MAG TPA: asparaginase domain-containing protein [Candidatus Binatia bacterium]|nr:asparaginase domain-containing protein [Candidatus Binatia bacterium]
MTTKKPFIAHLAGPVATIQNTPPLVTSNKARAKYGLPPRKSGDGSEVRFDVLRPQRLAAPATVYVEQFSAHPLEADAAELYGPPDGYVDAAGHFHKERRSERDTPVYEIELRPEDGLYPLPYMARQVDGATWEDDVAYPGAPEDRARQAFFPDGSRSFEEIDRLHVDAYGVGNLISSKATIAFHRVLPPAGYTHAGERRGIDFFPYKPRHLSALPPRPALARVANSVQRILSEGRYDGAIWTEGSPVIEETLYWLNLLVDTTLPICGNAAQRAHGQISNDGPRNIVDSVEYIVSRVWADDGGRNRAGVVLIAEQRVFSARAVMKLDARPGGYAATGGHGGVLGASGHSGSPLLHYIPTARHTYLSDVNITRLPAEVNGVGSVVPIKGADGNLLESAVPRVAIVKDGSYAADDYRADVESEVDLVALIGSMLHSERLAGIVVEGLAPYGTMTSAARYQLALRAIYSGIPVVRVGRGNVEGFARLEAPFISGSNLTATKARILLLAALMKLGSLPPAVDADNPTSDERAATRRKAGLYQELFEHH